MSGTQQRVPYALENDHFLWVPARTIQAPTVASITTVEDDETIAVNSGGKRSTASAGATAIFVADLAAELYRLSAITPGVGISITDLIIAYAIQTAVLTGNITAVLQAIGWPAVGTPAAAVSTNIPLSAGAGLQTAVTGAGQAATGRFAVAAPTQNAQDLQKLCARISVPMQNTGVFWLLGVGFHFNYQMSAV
jgi:hypothetical protein